jgi:hypothetical protein
VVRRLVRVGWRAAQTSSAYVLSIDETPAFPQPALRRHTGRVTLTKNVLLSRTALPDVPPAVRDAAIMALTIRRVTIEKMLLKMPPQSSSHRLEA